MVSVTDPRTGRKLDPAVVTFSFANGVDVTITNVSAGGAEVGVWDTNNGDSYVSWHRTSAIPGILRNAMMQ